MSEKLKGIFASNNLIRLVGLIIGVIVGKLIDKALWDYGMQDTVFHSEGYRLSWNDLATLLIGIVLMAFGGKIHRIVRWLGTGIVVYEVVEEINEFQNRSGATT